MKKKKKEETVEIDTSFETYDQESEKEEEE